MTSVQLELESALKRCQSDDILRITTHKMPCNAYFGEKCYSNNSENNLKQLKEVEVNKSTAIHNY